MIVRLAAIGALGILVLLAPTSVNGLIGTQTARAEGEASPWQTTVASGKAPSHPVKATKRPASASPPSVAASGQEAPKDPSHDGTVRTDAAQRTGLAHQLGVAVPGPIETGSVERPQENASATSAALVQPVATKDGPTGLPAAAKHFCVNIKPQVEELRTALQRKKMMQAEVELQKRITQLEERISEYKEWMGRRQEFINKVQDSLVKIYSKMRPEAVAQQLPSLDLETAAAVLLKLEPRTASAILNDTDPKLAATLASLISSSAQPAGESEKSNAPTP